MSESTEEKPLLRFTRSNFLKKTAALGVTLAVASLYSPSNTKEGHRHKDEGHIEGLPEITQAEFGYITQQSVLDFDRVLGLNISTREVIQKTHLVNLAEYQDALSKNETSYVPGNELVLSAYTSNADSPSGKAIFFYKGAIDHLSRRLPNTNEGQKARVDIIELNVDHELAHWTSAAYPSLEIHNLVFDKIVRDLPAYKGKSITPRMIEGATVQAYADGRKTNVFHNLEEAEAHLIGKYVFDHRGRPVSALSADKIPQAKDSDIFPVISHLVVLLRRLQHHEVNFENSLKMLARLRTEPGGREKFCKIIGEEFRVPAEDQLFFGLNLLYSIDVMDVPGFKRLMGL